MSSKYLKTVPPPPPQKLLLRNSNLDFLKGICITLMVIFHLAYIGDTYAYAKAIVYTFHMPIFLGISGYLSSPQKPAYKFLQTFFRLIRIYLIFQIIYLCASYYLPVRTHLDNLKLNNLLYHLLLKPIGPYWYLHSLTILHLGNFLGLRIANYLNKPQYHLIIFCSLLYIISSYGKLLSLESLVFYSIGFSLHLLYLNGYFANYNLTKFRNSFWLILPLILLCSNKQNLSSLSVFGLIIIILITLILIRLNQCPKLKIFHYLGKHSLFILLFSPIFTLSAKYIQPYFISIDHTAILFLILSTTMAITMSLMIAKIIYYLQNLLGIRFF